MSWWKKDKDLPLPQPKEDFLDGRYPPRPLTGLTPPQPSNVVEFPQKRKMDPEARAQSHKCLDQLMDVLGEDEYIMMFIIGPDEPLNSA